MSPRFVCSVTDCKQSHPPVDSVSQGEKSSQGERGKEGGRGSPWLRRGGERGGGEADDGCGPRVVSCAARAERGRCRRRRRLRGLVGPYRVGPRSRALWKSFLFVKKKGALWKMKRAPSAQISQPAGPVSRNRFPCTSPHAASRVRPQRRAA
jgi:hypothetical protein